MEDDAEMVAPPLPLEEISLGGCTIRRVVWDLHHGCVPTIALTHFRCVGG
jgi:hypothetical protein